jgi:hypothetical protein
VQALKEPEGVISSKMRRVSCVVKSSSAQLKVNRVLFCLDTPHTITNEYIMNQLQTSLKKNSLLFLSSSQLSSRALAPMSVILFEKLHSRPNIRHASTVPTQRNHKKYHHLLPKKKDQVLKYKPITLLSKSWLPPHELCLASLNSH